MSVSCGWLLVVEFDLSFDNLISAGVYHSLLVLIMLPLSLLGRRFYRRKEEGKLDPRFRRRPQPVPVDHKEIMTSTFSINNINNNKPGQKEEIFPDTFTYINNNENIPFVDGADHHVTTRDAGVWNWRKKMYW